jgi:hypothetical protein
VRLSGREQDVLFTSFNAGAGGDGVHYLQFVHRLRGEASRRRKELMVRAFASVDTSAVGRVPLSLLSEAYDPSKHPQVMSGQLTVASARTQLCGNLLGFRAVPSRYCE